MKLNLVFTIAALLPLTAGMTGCMSTLRVYRADSVAAPPRGIPFYAKKAVCRQQSIWIEPQYIISYNGAEKIFDYQRFSSTSGFLANPTDQGWSALAGQTAVVANETPNEVEQESGRNWFLVANTAAVMPMTDYSQVFYLNTVRPLIGTAQVAAKLAADGSLTEAGAQVQDQTASTIIGAVPGLLTASAGFAARRTLSPESTVHPQVTTRLFKHIHSQEVELTQGMCSPAQPAVIAGAFTVSEVDDRK